MAHPAFFRAIQENYNTCDKAAQAIQGISLCRQFCKQFTAFRAGSNLPTIRSLPRPLCLLLSQDQGKDGERRG